jgi:transmembrane sensor
MTHNIVKLPDMNKMKEEGSLWLAKLDRGLSPDEEVLLKCWLAKSAENRTYFITLAKQWDQLAVLSQLADIIPYEPKVPKTQLTFFAKAATLVFVFILGALFLTATNSILFNHHTYAVKPVFLKSYTTVTGEKSTIYLPDSSILTLNTDSMVKVHFTPKQRNITLVKGEVHINVAHNTKQKLVLSAGEKSFVAVGTAFNVRYDKQTTVELIVTEGKVGIADIENIDKVQTLFSKSNQDSSLLVNAGQRVIIPPKDTLSHNELTKEDIKQTMADSLAWRDGRLIFKGETLEEVVNEMSRYSNITIELEGEELKKVKIGGRFKTGDIDGLLDLLNQQFNIKSNRLSSSKVKLSLNNPLI